MGGRRNFVNTIASVIFLACFVSMVMVGQTPCPLIGLSLAFIGTVSACLAEPLFGRLHMTLISVLFVSGILKMSNCVGIQLVLLAVEGALIVFYIRFVRTGKSQSEKKLGRIAIAVADILFFADFAMTCLL